MPHPSIAWIVWGPFLPLALISAAGCESGEVGAVARQGASSRLVAGEGEGDASEPETPAAAAVAVAGEEEAYLKQIKEELAAAWKDSGEVVSASAAFAFPPGGKEGELFILARIKPEWHIFSVTQPKGGPLATKIKLDKSEQFETAGDFRPLSPPKKRFDKIFEADVEEHEGEVVWRAAIKLKDGVDPAGLKIRGAVYAQTCRAEVCQAPKDFPFAASPAKTKAERPADGADGGRTVSSRAGDRLLDDLGTRRRGVDWPSFLGPTGDSKSPETGIISDWTKGLRIVWQRRLNTGYGIGTVSRGRYFHFERIGDRATLFCLNAETGEELWTFDYATDFEDLYGYNNGPRCSPIVDGDRVYAFGAEGMLHCLKTGDGELVWKVNTSEKFGVVQNFFGVGSTPAVEGELLLAVIGGSPPEDQRIPPGQLGRVSGNGCGIVAFDKRTGEVKYQITDELAGYASMKTATVNGRRWGFAFCRGGLVGFEPSTGKVDFHYPWRADILESVNASMPVVKDDLVFISETYGPGSSLLRVKPGGCTVVWKDDERSRAKAMQTHWNTPIEHEGFIYGCSGRHEGTAELRCIEMATGRVKWSVPQDEMTISVSGARFTAARTSLMFVEGHFIVLGEFGQLWLIRANPERYDEVSSLLLRDESAEEIPEFGSPPLLKPPCWAAPILSHGLLYVRGEGRLVCLELIPEAT